jgi:L-fuconolactonase
MTRNSPAIVDAHVHLWNPERFRYSWLDGLPPLNRTMLPEDFADATASTGISKFIFVECGCEPAQSLQEVDWMAGLAETHPQLKGIIAHAPLERGKAILADLESLAGRPLVKGVRRNLQAENNDFFKRPALVEGLKLLPGFNFTFDLCIRADQLPAASELVRSVPQVTFVLDHFGKPPVRDKSFEPWARNLRALAGAPNVVCKISGLTTEANWVEWQRADLEPYFDHALACFGLHRVMFGSDWPVATLATTYQRWIETVLDLFSFANERERAQLFQTNAERIYRV